MKSKKDWVFQDSEDYIENAYEWTIICENCNHKNYISIRKGIEVPDFIICENCGCSTTEDELITTSLYKSQRRTYEFS